MDKQELEILQVLDAIAGQESVSTIIDSMVARVRQKLTQDLEALLAWEQVPLATYGGELPDILHSSWVFIVRAKASTGAERHPNSCQRMMSYRGSGDLQIWTGGRWHSNLLVSDPEEQIERRWISIPPNIWHQAVVLEGNWVVLSFHTIPEYELIEERPGPTDTRLTHQRRYSDGQK